MPNPLIRGRTNNLAAFRPPRGPALQLWLDAGFGVYQDAARTTPAVADTDPIGGWTDRSGKGNHASQATAGLRPTLKLAQINGRPTVLWTAASAQYLSADSAAAAFAGTNIPLTLIAVMRYVTNSGQFSFTLASTVSANQRGEFYQSSTPTHQITLRTDANVTPLTTGGTNPGTTFHLVTFLVDGTNATILQEGVVVAGPTSQGSGAYTYNNLTLGGLVSTTPVAGVYLNGHVAELLWWNVALTAGEQQYVRMAMAKKYGISST